LKAALDDGAGEGVGAYAREAERAQLARRIVEAGGQFAAFT
jgi:hypothetical protein